MGIAYVLWQGDGFVVPEKPPTNAVGEYRIVDQSRNPKARFIPERLASMDAMGCPRWEPTSWSDLLVDKLLARVVVDRATGQGTALPAPPANAGSEEACYAESVPPTQPRGKGAAGEAVGA